MIGRAIRRVSDLIDGLRYPVMHNEDEEPEDAKPGDLWAGPLLPSNPLNNWSVINGEPDNGSGTNNDFVIDRQTNNYYWKIADVWVFQGTLKGSDGIDGIDGINGIDGIDGLSAYELALDNGFQGALSDWINSLNGTNGKSAYELALDGGYQGTEAQWLLSLKGTDGAGSPTVNTIGALIDGAGAATPADADNFSFSVAGVLKKMAFSALKLALLPWTTLGDLLYLGAANTVTTLGIGATGYVLTVVAGVPSWQPSAGGAATTIQSVTFVAETTYTANFNNGRIIKIVTGNSPVTITLSNWAGTGANAGVDGCWLYITQGASDRQITLATSNLESSGSYVAALPSAGATKPSAFCFCWTGSKWMITNMLYNIVPTA